MTAGGRPVGDANEPAREEQLLQQALRAMAGGGRVEQRPAGDAGSGDRRRLSVTQVLLVAAIIGVVVGMGAGLLFLLLT